MRCVIHAGSIELGLDAAYAVFVSALCSVARVDVGERPDAAVVVGPARQRVNGRSADMALQGHRLAVAWELPKALPYRCAGRGL